MDDSGERSLANLVGRASAGDEASWNAIVERFGPLIWSVVRSHRLTAEEAADVSQLVWLRLVERLGDIRDPAALPGWLVTTARRESLAILRRRHREQEFRPEDEAASSDPSPEQVVEDHDQQAALMRAFRRLSPRCQNVLRLLLIEPAPSYAEASALLNMPVGSLGPTRQRCLGQLRRLMDEDRETTEAELIATFRDTAAGAGRTPAGVIESARRALSDRPADGG